LIRFERVNILFDQNAPIFVWLIWLIRLMVL
jgi:hypothetical protein